MVVILTRSSGPCTVSNTLRGTRWAAVPNDASAMSGRSNGWARVARGIASVSARSLKPLTRSMPDSKAVAALLSLPFDASCWAALTVSAATSVLFATGASLPVPTLRVAMLLHSATLSRAAL